MKQKFKSILYTTADILLIFIVIMFILGILGMVAAILSSLLFSNELPQDILSIIQSAVFIIVPLFIWKVIKKRKLSEMGLSKFKDCSSNFVQGLIMGIVTITLAFILVVIFGKVKITFTNYLDFKNYFIYLILFILVGFSEEIFSRGYIFSTISDGSKKGKITAIIVTSIIFSSLHLGNDHITLISIINLFLVGVVYGYMYYLTDNIWMSIGCHITWNYFQGTILGFNVSGTSVSSILIPTIEEATPLNGGQFGIEGSIFCTLILILQIIYLYKTKPQKI